MYKNYEVVVDTTQKSKHNSIVVNTNDLKTFKLSITINQSKKPIDLTGATVRLAIVKPDKTTVFQDCSIVDAANGKCEIILNSQAYLLNGVHVSEVMVYFDSERVAVTGRFSYSVMKGLLDGNTLESQNDWQAINKAISDAEGILIDLRENGTGVDAQARADLETVSAELAQIGTNVMSLGAKGDGSDDTSVLQEILNSYVGEPIYFPQKTFHITSLTIPANSNIFFRNTIFKRVLSYSDNGDHLTVQDGTKLYGDFILDGNQSEAASPNKVGVRLRNNINVFGKMTVRNVPGHGVAVTGVTNVFIDEVESYDNGDKDVVLDNVGTGDGLVTINSKDIHVNKAILYRNGRNGLSACEYGVPMDNQLFNNIVAFDNAYYDVDVEDSVGVTINYLRGKENKYPKVGVNYAKRLILTNAEVSRLTGGGVDKLEDVTLDKVKVFPVDNFSFFLEGKDLKVSNVTYKNTLETYAGSAIEIVDSGTSGQVSDIVVEKASNGYRIVSENVRNLYVKEYSGLIGTINGRSVSSANYQKTVRVDGGKRSEYSFSEPINITNVNVGDIVYLANVPTVHSPTHYYFSGSQWIPASATNLNQNYITQNLIYSNCSYAEGGYLQFSRYVIINITVKLTANASISELIRLLPPPTHLIGVQGYNKTKNTVTPSYLSGDGKLYATGETNDEICFSVTYRRA